MKNIWLFLILSSLTGCIQADTESEADSDTDIDSAFRIMIDQRVSETNYSQVAMQDLNLSIKDSNWSLEDAKAQRMVSEVLDEAIDILLPLIGDNYIGSAVSMSPGQPPMIYIKGEVSQAVREQIPDGILINTTNMYSLAELKERKKQTLGALRSLGYVEMGLGIDIKRNAVNVTVMQPKEGPASLLIYPQDVIDALPRSLQNNIFIKFGSEPFAVMENSFGGISVLRNNSVGCTTGWSVEDGSGNTGVTTAAHCYRPTEIQHWGGDTHSILLEGAHVGDHGDVAWYSSDADDLAYFYFDGLANEVREVQSVATAAKIKINTKICIYGLGTNSRDCSARVLEINFDCVTPSYTKGNLVKMNKHITTGGDSGGGWSFNNTAFGSHVGVCEGMSVFTPAHQFNDAIGVTVITR